MLQFVRELQGFDRPCAASTVEHSTDLHMACNSFKSDSPQDTIDSWQTTIFARQGGCVSAKRDPQQLTFGSFSVAVRFYEKRLLIKIERDCRAVSRILVYFSPDSGPAAQRQNVRDLIVRVSPSETVQNKRTLSPS